MPNAQNQLIDSQTLAAKAMAQMTERNVPPTPHNFEIWYHYAAGTNPELVTAVDAVCSADASFTEQVTEDLHHRFFTEANMGLEVLAVGDRIQSELAKSLESLEQAGKDQKKYSNVLDGVAGALDADTDVSTLGRTITHLLNATSQMSARTQKLEMELKSSSNEVSSLKESLEDMRQETLTDQLTGIANRRCFDQRLREAIEECGSGDKPVSLLIGDIDFFKKFNDTWGHQTGDQVLKLVAHCLKENVKGRDTAARYGGEEFAVILPDADLTGAVNVAEQIRHTVETKRVVKRSTGDTLGAITLSLGAATFRPGENPMNLIARADACLYQAKREGRNKVVGEDQMDEAELTKIMSENVA